LEPKRWGPFLVMIFVLGVVLAQPLLMVLSSMTGVVILIANWWRERVLDQVTYVRRPYYRRAFPGEEVSVQIEVENGKLLPVSWLRVSDPWPEAVGPADESTLTPSHIPQVGLLTNTYSLRWFERVRRTYTLVFRQRGVYRIGPARMESGDLFGFYETAQRDGPTEHLTVFPRVYPFRALPLPTEDPFGERTSRRRLYEDPTLPMGVRDYRPEDDFRRVHWPATARTGELQSRVYQPVSARVVVVCLNVATFARHWEGTDRDVLEHAISVAAGLVTRGMEDGYRIGLISNGALANSDQPFRLLPARSTKHLALLLQSLAGVTTLLTAPFDRFLIREVPRLPYRSTLMILTAVVYPALIETLLRLKRHGRRITLISLDSAAPPEIPGIRTVHAPFHPEGALVGGAINPRSE
jgi:uncharacterized protein (DUF58 family)